MMKYHQYPQVRYVNAKRCPWDSQHRRCRVFVTPKGEETKPRTEAMFCGAGQRSVLTALILLLCFLRGLDGHQHLLVQSSATLATQQR